MLDGVLDVNGVVTLEAIVRYRYVGVGFIPSHPTHLSSDLGWRLVGSQEFLVGKNNLKCEYIEPRPLNPEPSYLLYGMVLYAMKQSIEKNIQYL